MISHDKRDKTCLLCGKPQTGTNIFYGFFPHLFVTKKMNLAFDFLGFCCRFADIVQQTSAF